MLTSSARPRSAFHCGSSLLLDEFQPCSETNDETCTITASNTTRDRTVFDEQFNVCVFVCRLHKAKVVPSSLHYRRVQFNNLHNEQQREQNINPLRFANVYRLQLTLTCALKCFLRNITNDPPPSPSTVTLRGDVLDASRANAGAAKHSPAIMTRCSSKPR